MNTRLRCLLIDDEPLALDRLERLLASYPDIEVLGKITRPSKAVERINSLKPDLIFLDIQMPGMTGFEVLQKALHQPVVIFVTAYDRYALEAFEVNSVDYLLKPVEKERLDKAIQKLRLLSGQATDALTMPSEQVDRLLEYLELRVPRKPRKLVSRQGERMILIEPSQVAYFYAQSKYTFAVTAQGEHILDYTLQELRDWLPDEKFIPIHRSYIVNLDWIAELSRGFAGGYLCRLKAPVSRDLPISRSLVHQVRERIRF
jgi:two-component system, LytTR family, response regulator